MNTWIEDGRSHFQTSRKPPVRPPLSEGSKIKWSFRSNRVTKLAKARFFSYLCKVFKDYNNNKQKLNNKQL